MSEKLSKGEFEDFYDNSSGSENFKQKMNTNTLEEILDSNKDTEKIKQLQAELDKAKVAAKNLPNRIAAKGYGLNDEQQKAIADLWDWQEQKEVLDILSKLER